MTTDERLMFHLTEGFLRRWSLWNEDTLPSFAAGEATKHAIFQSWRHAPFTVIGKNEDGSDQIRYHPMAEFENWPYWMILDLCRFAFRNEPFEGLLIEPDQLKETICDLADQKFTENEESSRARL